MNELRRANPVTVQQAEALVGVDRRLLVDALNEASASHPNSGDSGRRAQRRVPRAKAFAGAMAAAFVLVFAGITLTNQLSDRNVIQASVASPTSVGDDVELVTLAHSGFDRSSDLLAVHFDFAQLADAHSAAAAREVTEWFNLDPVIVAGTQTVTAERTVHDYALVMDAVWPQRWIDAGKDRPGALNQSLERWLVTLDAGGNVWVADSGVSDFTAELVREVSQQRPGLDTQSLIHVVQHNVQNETANEPGVLNLLQAKTDYSMIGEGSVSNDTAALVGPSAELEAAVLSGPYRNEWAAAFEYLSASSLDLADSVLLLDILNVATQHVANAGDFADFFIGDQPDAVLREGS